MPIQPKLGKQIFQTKKCNKCGEILDIEEFAPTHSEFYPDHHLPICNECVVRLLRATSFSWDRLDKICQWADIPFIVKEWERLEQLNGTENTWPVYARVFGADCYKTLGWKDYQTQYQKLREAGVIEDEIPLVGEDKWERLRHKWGPNYDNDEIQYLEDLFHGILNSQNVNGDLQMDQAQKICKLSLEIDNKIRAGDKEVDKFMSSYDKLVKTAEFTPKNTKNAADFDSFAEVAVWLEKRGRQNHFYDNVTRDVIDETLKNIESYNQRLYVNEGGIGEEISERLKSLSSVNAMEEETSIYGVAQEFAEDEYENSGFLVEESEFDPGGDDDDEPTS